MLTLFLAMLFVPPLAGPATADLGFLAGCWRAERGGRVTLEQWMAPDGGAMLGMSRAVAGGKMVEHEFLLIVERADGVYYVARPSGQAEAAFKLVTVGQGEAVFENPDHDFPQRIAYRVTGPGKLTARVEGAMDGKTRGFDIPYERAACTPD